VGRRVAEAGWTALRACFVAFVLARAWLRVLLRRGSRDEEVYRAAVRLGPTAMKLAQVVSTRPDLVPPSLSRRLESLQEDAPRFSFEEARKVVEQELGSSIDALFQVFPAEPTASASLSQVYFAALPDGSEVAVKVQRPGIERRIQRDVRILRDLARLVTLLRPSLRSLHLADAAAEFGRWTLQELDFRLEGQNADEFRRNFVAWPDIDLPAIHWSHTRRRVLTMERVRGRRVKEMVTLLDEDARMGLVRRLADMVMKMFVDDGFFHADLHPGNIFFPEDGRIVLLDLGMVGRMSRTQADRFLAYWMAVGRRQRERAFHHLLALAVPTQGGDVSGYRAAYDRILDEFEGSTVTEKSLARTYFDVIQGGARHGVVFPSEMLLQAKALITMEALCLFMAPGFRFSEEIRPIVARRAAQRASPKSLLDKIWTMLPDLVIAGEWFYTERHSRDREAEPAFRRYAILATTEVWIDAADVWLGVHREDRLPNMEDRPHLAALLDLVAQAVTWGNRAGVASVSDGDAASWRQGRPWLDAIPAAFLTFARLALARAEAALREQMDRAAGEGQSEHDSPG
jgi:predicted unusual protein kinase regulating ubiquinone biosynthesis (AarF/ABC1/UbiB family)